MGVAMYVRAFIMLILALAVSTMRARGEARSQQDSAVLAPIEKLFDGMAHRNSETIKSAALPGTMMVLMRDGKPEHMTIEAFAERVARPSQNHIQERIQHPLIRVDRDLAVVWASFEFLVDGKLEH